MMPLKYILCIFFFLVTERCLAQTGVIAWQRCLGGLYRDIGKAIEVNSEGGYTMLGSTRSYEGDVSANKGDYDIWIVRVNDTGGVLWQKTLGGSGADMG